MGQLAHVTKQSNEGAIAGAVWLRVSFLCMMSDGLSLLCRTVCMRCKASEIELGFIGLRFKNFPNNH